MQLSEDIKKKITSILDSKEFMTDLYAGLDKEKRIELGQFYTPAKICIQMIEKYETEAFSNMDILDPTCGSGNLLIAMLIAGADSQRLYGNEYDAVAVKLCKKRLNRACDILHVPHIRDFQIHQGNALQKRCLTDFNTTYQQNYKPKYIDDLQYAQGRYGWDMDNKEAERRFSVKTTKQERQEQLAADPLNLWGTL